jgi:hypothetical protein
MVQTPRKRDKKKVVSIKLEFLSVHAPPSHGKNTEKNLMSSLYNVFDRWN